jgi:hypothetical protein
VVTLTSKDSHRIQFPGGSDPIVVLHGTRTVTVETGVAVFSLVGTNAHDWTRDSLSFPIGIPCAPADFVSGIASASPTSFWTPYSLAPAGSNLGPDIEPVVVQPVPDAPLGVGRVFIPPLGAAVDSALVSYSASAGQPVLQLALAVFGTSTELMRVSYTAFVVTGRGEVVFGSGTGTITEH